MDLILDLGVHPADIQDYDAGREVLAKIVAYDPLMINLMLHRLASG